LNRAPAFLRRIAWFVALWLAGVACVSLVALAIRAAIAETPPPSPPAWNIPAPATFGPG
jgi:hypothetical protein